MILVVGATGLLGGEICRQLRSRGHAVRGLVREGSPGERDLRTLGIEIAHGDLRDAASLRSACAGVVSVVTTANAIVPRRSGDSLVHVDRDGTLALVEAARGAAVQHFVYTSVGPSLSSRSPFVAFKRQVEDAVRGSGMAWTILQPSAFMQIHLGPAVGWDLAAAKAQIFGSGAVQQTYIDLRDVARFAVAALEHEALRGADMVLGGPEAMTPLDALRVFEQVTGRKFTVSRMPAAMMTLLASGLRPFNPSFSSLLVIAHEGATRGDRIDMAPLLARMPEPVQLRSVRDYVEGAWAALQGSGRSA